MKGIYLTEESKQEIEAKIVELQKRKESLFESRKEFSNKLENSEFINDFLMQNTQSYSRILFEIDFYKEILTSSTILPVEESYNDIQHFETTEYGTIIRKHFLIANYSNGVIIQPK